VLALAQCAATPRQSVAPPPPTSEQQQLTPTVSPQELLERFNVLLNQA
jgi:hypothetical protein